MIKHFLFEMAEFILEKFFVPSFVLQYFEYSRLKVSEYEMYWFTDFPLRHSLKELYSIKSKQTSIRKIIFPYILLIFLILCYNEALNMQEHYYTNRFAQLYFLRYLCTHLYIMRSNCIPNRD